VLDCTYVTQIDVLEEYQLLLVLSNKALLSYSLEALEVSEAQSPLVKRPRKIQNHAAFFQTGVCVGRHLVCSAKASGMSTTIKVFEPMETVTRNARGRMGAFGGLFQGSQDTLKPFKVRQIVYSLFNLY
jgi:RHO1 GDP-GTP exchange protein 1/2